MNIPLFIIILIISKSNSDKVEDHYSDLMECMDQDTNSCSSVSLKTKDLECCYVDIHYNQQYLSNIETCAPIFSNYLSNDMKKSVEAMAREEFGVLEYFSGLGINSIGSFTTLYKCKKKSMNFTFGGYTYTSSEIEILKSENNCFRLFYYSIGDVLGINKKDIVKNDCLNAKILDTTKQANINCGFSEFTILWSDDTNTDFNSCYYLPKIAIKSKQLDSQTESFLNEMNNYVSLREKKTSKSYKVKITDSDGNVLIYDSATGSVSYENFIKVKSLVLFMLLAFLF
jgi:hypothetical protein